ncbi:MAG TPA: hypothetical protein VGM75_23800 [Pseudonocardiaceae bacterium]
MDNLRRQGAALVVLDELLDDEPLDGEPLDDEPLDDEVEPEVALEDDEPLPELDDSVDFEDESELVAPAVAFVFWPDSERLSVR